MSASAVSLPPSSAWTAVRLARQAGGVPDPAAPLCAAQALLVAAGAGAGWSQLATEARCARAAPRALAAATAAAAAAAATAAPPLASPSFPPFRRLLQPPDGVDGGAWVAEHLRLATTLLGELLSALSASGACTARSCPAMRVGEQVFLCAAHGGEADGGGGPRACCAPDYAAHTLDAAQALLAAPWAFPSRAAVRSASAAAPHFANVARRLYRPLAHAWRHHAAEFAAFEAATRCTARLEAIARKHALLADDAIVIRAYAPQRDGDGPR
jgi:hypothetical protein